MIPPTKGMRVLPGRPELSTIRICSGDGSSGVMIVWTRSLMRIWAVRAAGSMPSVGKGDVGIARAVEIMVVRRSVEKKD